ncbi:MAG: hypothetical protein AAGB00_03380 [Planctomycetota bacterium]
MATYLLSCSCGESVPVEPRQCGEMVTCPCGIQIEAPTLRQMQQLPPAERQQTVAASGWGYRQGVLTAGFLLTAALVGVGVYFMRNEPLPLQRMDRDQKVARGVETMTPKSMFDLWRVQYQPIFSRGRLDVFVDQYQVALDREILMYRLYRWTSFGLAAAVGVGSVVAAASARPPE